MVRGAPRSLKDLHAIPGVGESKIVQFGFFQRSGSSTSLPCRMSLALLMRLAVVPAPGGLRARALETMLPTSKSLYQNDLQMEVAGVEPASYEPGHRILQA